MKELELYALQQSATITMNYEIAWKIDDVLKVLKSPLVHGQIIIGGDILAEDLMPNYDSWYYNPDPLLTRYENSIISLEEAEKYLNIYTKNNGKGYYVVLVLQR